MSIVSGRSSYMHGRPRIIIHDEPPRPAAGSLPRLRPPRRASVHRAPQEVIDDFWAEFQSKRPGKATSIIPQRAYADKAARRIAAQAASGSQSTTASYAEAAAQCRAKVAHIVKECRRVNQKYRDPHFDLELDLQLDRRDCLESLSNVCGIDYGPSSGRGRGRRNPSAAPPPPPPYIAPSFNPQAVKRVDDIFDHPEFFIDGPTANDVRQGRDGDCWLMAALCTLSNKPGLIERVCLAHDAAVGVYGFVFHRDGEWFSEIIDDKLYLTKPDYDESRSERNMLEDRVRINSEEAYRKIYQSNSGALYFAQCENPNETWLPLLEKAYAKAHGDYAAIEGGFTGEGIEDLTGGVTSELYTTDILDKEYFWKEELMKVNDTFLFGCSTGVWGKGRGDRGGIVEQHAYSVMRAIEMDGVRLVLLKNPWGRHEWKGAWSDGSKEWTADWIQKLNHRFGDDGSFWISYEDLLRKYQAFDRTRLFGDDWATASIWTTMTVPWTLEYNDSKFSFTLARPGPVVLVLSQLDERYFRGLEGQYLFSLSFRLHKVGADGEPRSSEEEDAFDYIVRSQASYRMSRSVSVEVDLDAGRYLVLVKIDAQRDDSILPAEDVIRDNVRLRREKLIRIGLAYDLAHSKGRVAETAAEKKARRAAAEKRTARQKERLKKHIMEERALDYLAAKLRLKKQKKGMAKAKAKRKERDARRRARMEEEERAAEEPAREEDSARARTKMDKRDSAIEGANYAGGGVPGGDDGGNSEVGMGQKGGDMPVGDAPVVHEESTKQATAVHSASTDTPADTPTGILADVTTSSNDNGNTTKAAAEEPESPRPVARGQEGGSLQSSPQDRKRLSANYRRPSFEGGRDDGSHNIRHDTRASSRGSRGVQDNSREPSILSHGRGRADGRQRDIPLRGRTSRPASPIHAPIPRGRSVSRYPSPPAFGRRYSRTPPPQRANHPFLGHVDDDNDPRGRRVAPHHPFHAPPGRSANDDSELSSLSSPSDISDDELDFIYKEQSRGASKHNGHRHGAPSGPDGRRGMRPPSPRPVVRDRCGSNESLRGDYGVGDPWNAIAVVGLRVYYQEVDGDGERGGSIIQLGVERAHPFSADRYSGTDDDTGSDTTSLGDTDDDMGRNSDATANSDSGKAGSEGTSDATAGVEDGTSGEEKVLDVDDSLKDATGSIPSRASRRMAGDR
ncbi:hypothetical protein Sste5346_007709 [Sporothrix stenoceras]|uniref:Calpain catalytic domain-containing protein n=1 Tax=Sporothrix stenoceras TaxID=5173 RepID=A0ABR3YST8_9PEZI